MTNCNLIDSYGVFIRNAYNQQWTIPVSRVDNSAKSVAFNSFVQTSGGKVYFITEFVNPCSDTTIGYNITLKYTKI